METLICNCITNLILNDFYCKTESKVIKSATSSTTVIAPNFSSARRKRNTQQNRTATYTLESSSNADVVVTIPEEAFQGNSDALLVALLKSDTTLLPKQPANVPGDFSGKLQILFQITLWKLMVQKIFQRDFFLKFAYWQ